MSVITIITVFCISFGRGHFVIGPKLSYLHMLSTSLSAFFNVVLLFFSVVAHFFILCIIICIQCFGTGNSFCSISGTVEKE